MTTFVCHLPLSLSSSLLLLIALLVIIISPSCGCVIHNSDSGICTTRYLPISRDLQAIEESKKLWQADLPFCGQYIASYYSPCVPATPTSAWVAADANFPTGRIVDTVDGNDDGKEDVHSIRNKDRWVEQTVASTIQSRIDLDKHDPFKNRDCQEAYAKFTCWLNFPRCHDESDESLPMCQSACENLFRVCNIASDMWRCDADVVDGNDEYDIRAFFPGQPFTQNEYYPKSNEPLPVCTPSIKGAAVPRYKCQVVKWWYLLLLLFSYCIPINHTYLWSTNICLFH